MSKSRFSSFFTGALVGVGLGILLAPKEGSETRKDLKNSFSILIDTIKDIDIEESKNVFLDKVKEIKESLATIDEDTAKEIVKEKVAIIEEQCDDLIDTAKEQKAYVVEKAANEVKENAGVLLKEFLEELEEVKEEPKKEENKEQKKPTTKTVKKNTSSPKKKSSNKPTTSKKKITKKTNTKKK